MPGRTRANAYIDRAATRSLGLLSDPTLLQKLKRRSNTTFDVDAAEVRMVNNLLPYQKDFVCDFDHKYVGFCGGYGCVAGETLINGRPIKELTAQPIQVQTLAGPTWATPAYKKGVAPLYRVRTSAGQEVLVTKAHRFLTPFGWQELAHLQPGALIAVRDNFCADGQTEKATNLNGADRVGSRSCDELPTPWEAFYQEQAQQFFVPSIFHDPCPSYQPDACLDLQHSSHRAAHHDSLALHAGKETPSWFPRELQNDERLPEYQLRQLYSRESLHHGSHTVSQSRFGEHLGSPSLRQPSFSLFSLDQRHRQRIDNLVSSLVDSLSCISAAAPLSRDPIHRAASLTCDQTSALASRCRSSYLLTGISAEESFHSCKARRSPSALAGSAEQPWSTVSNNSRYNWSTVEEVAYVRTDDFYDLHVPTWNHYEAHGILHHNSGKSYSLVVKQLLLCFRSQGFTHLFLEPTIPLIDDVALPTWNLVLEKYGIPHSFRVSPRPVFTLHLPGGETPVLLRSMENFERLIGVNAASIASDETDTTRAEIAEKAMIKLQGRVRVGNCPQIVAASTPEGYGWMYSFFEEQKADNKKLYRGKSEDNPYLDPGFVEDLKTKYHPQLIKAYLNGEFVNLESATVFYEFNRDLHTTGVFTPERGERIVFGVDFNVGQCHAVYGVVRPGQKGQQLHCFAESKVADTFALVAHLQKTYPFHLSRGQITCYPDASGSHDSTSSTQSDHEILRSAGIQVVAERRNPPIAETLAHANVHMHRGLVLINPTNCQNTISATERWSYDSKTLKPAKGGATDYSHPGDALRYLIWQVFPRAGARAGHGGRWR